jgi:hypothetical protein
MTATHLHESAEGLDVHLLKAEVLGVGDTSSAHKGGVNVEGGVRDLLLCACTRDG